jgi:hypothetical protein
MILIVGTFDYVPKKRGPPNLYVSPACDVKLMAGIYVN